MGVLRHDSLLLHRLRALGGPRRSDSFGDGSQGARTGLPCSVGHRGELTYPVVYIFPMLGFAGAQAVVNIQVGYCVSDVISKCGVGLTIYSITSAKSQLEKSEKLLG